MLDDFGEGGGFVDGEVGEDFAVKLDTFFLHAANQLAVAGVVFASGVVDASDPERAQVALTVATITIGVAEGFDDALLGHTIAAGAIMLHAFGGLEDLFVLFAGWDASFDSHG